MHPSRACRASTCLYSIYHHRSRAVVQFLFFVATLSVHVVSGHSVQNDDKTHDPFIRQLSDAVGDYKDENVPFTSWRNTLDTLRYALAFIVLLVAAHPLGRFFPHCFKLPLITGYLVIGIIAGPFVANLLTQHLVNALSTYVTALALSFFSFQAGQEIYLPELRPQLKSIVILLSVLYGTAMVLLTTAILGAESAFFYHDLALNCQVGIALMFGSISVLGSPTTVMAIKIELNSVGPFTNLMLGATMTAELVVLVSFSISRILCSIYCAKLEVSMSNLLFTMTVVLSNVLVGLVLAGVTLAIFHLPRGEHRTHEQPRAHWHRDASPSGSAYYNLESTRSNSKASRNNDERSSRSRHAPHSMVASFSEHARPRMGGGVTFAWTRQSALFLKGVIWLTMGFVVYLSTSLLAHSTSAAYGLSWEVKFEPLLVLMIAACVAGHHASIRQDMHVILDTAAPYMFLPFFVMTGAALKLDQVVHAIPLMTVYVLLRYAAIFIACYVGGRFLLHLPPRQYNNLWLTMTPQAGVALGLAHEVQALSTETWAADFAATIVAAVVLNQIVGPVLCAMGLGRAGETLDDRTRVSEREGVHWDADSSRHVESRGNGAACTLRQSRFSSRASSVHRDSRRSWRENGDAILQLPLYKVRQAVVIGDDDEALEIALGLALYGAHVNVPLLDEEHTSRWQKMNETILQRVAKNELISYTNTLKDHPDAKAMASADVIVFTGDAHRTRENVHLLKSLLGDSHPRMIALVPDANVSNEMKAQGVLVIQPSIALANLATRMALLEPTMAHALSSEISTTSDFSTASYLVRRDSDLLEKKLDSRLGRGRSGLNHHSVDYDRLVEMVAAAQLAPPAPPSRVAMFGTSGYDPFSWREHEPSFFVMHEEQEAGEEPVPQGCTKVPPRQRISVF
ncbi:hypothetical protein PsorP6_013958 [Peronosclerospora sorghi]|uniref:Uncharacterized protein n=1 Tax=Peronosclerospora sorghi TaxID=230839 RepID=A0ACC0VFU9_9STRA|nr:hypothetical protein PsorP6_013958 [Peronosclerospora sorghi]